MSRLTRRVGAGLNRPGRMDHPKDRSRLSRRQFVTYAAGSAVGLGAVGALAGCENTTTPIGAGAGGLTGEAAKLVVQKPTGPGGLPLPRPDNAVTWGITETNKPIADGRPDRTRATAGLQLRRLHRPGADQALREAVLDLGPDRDLQLVRRGDREARVRRRRLRRGHRPDRFEHRQPDRAEAAAAAEPLVPLEPRQERLARAAGPVLRPRRPLHGAVRRLERRDRLAQRQGEGRHRGHGRPVGHLLARAGLSRAGRASSTTSATR